LSWLETAFRMAAVFGVPIDEVFLEYSEDIGSTGS
jgi:DNA-binding XRE family transcriptional regulator